jgi:hypothetical protein
LKLASNGEQTSEVAPDLIATVAQDLTDVAT